MRRVLPSDISIVALGNVMDATGVGWGTGAGCSGAIEVSLLQAPRNRAQAHMAMRARWDGRAVMRDECEGMRDLRM
ncbi:MAG TPA: hypothetical protein DGD08_00475 [Gemmatimonas aurantiaca]|uniref:Uncharacterized protein n=1 Tax=Gemmatimonas aurantiaca TaxID=173480 RepID=A0A3D4V4E6_9BACT|nr:hypothetical protein [Gemmatimonas aurantiaca]